MKKLVISKICMAIIFAVMCISCTNITEATVTRVYQPLRSGMVHTYLEVQFADSTTSSVVLPDNDAIWDKARNMKGKKVKVKKSKDQWTFVDFVE
jgi:hypothetical protein